MKKNMGNADRIIRTIVALLVGYLYFTGAISGTLGVILLVVSVVFLLTSFISFFPIYTLLGINTCKAEGKS